MADETREPGRVVELFAGVGGFRLGLEGEPGTDGHGENWRVVWSNQWEPSTKSQPASDCYTFRFGPNGHVNADIAAVLDAHETGTVTDLGPALPPHDLLVGGFPCQDYSVAKPLSQSDGIAGKKGVLWWDIERILDVWRPPYVLLENVDRLLKSPSAQRGRDFAVMLACFARLGYRVQWRVVNAADYGHPQRRRRVFIVAERVEDADVLRVPAVAEADSILTKTGTLAKALPAHLVTEEVHEEVGDDPFEVSETFGVGRKISPWRNAGVMVGGKAVTFDVEADLPDGTPKVLRDVLQPDAEVPEEFYLSESAWESWTYLKGAKAEKRTKALPDGAEYEYIYQEGGVAFPDPLDRPSRTILTSEGGTSPSRFKIVVETADGFYRRLTPVELERLNGFPAGWTKWAGEGKRMSDGRRAFCMGNALVVGLVQSIGGELARVRATGGSTFG